MDKLTKQRAFDYSMYVMLSSYFDHAVCISDLQRKKLALAYQELKDEDKDFLDGQSVTVIEKELLPNLPADFTKQKMQLSLVGSDDKMYTEVRLSNEEYVLRIKAKYAKRGTKLIHEVWKKRYKKENKLPRSDKSD